MLMMLGVLALAAVAAGCGSSSGPTSSAAGASTTPNFRTAAGRAQIAACLKKQGVTLPQRPRGAPPAGGPGPGGGGFLFGGAGGAGAGQRPRGFRADPKVAAALRKCGVSGKVRRFAGGPNGGRFKQTLSKFVACMKKNGYALPKPNTSGNGPVFDPSKVNRNDPKFKSAAQKCQSLLRPGAQAGATT
jgi:hypothetical protein